MMVHFTEEEKAIIGIYCADKVEDIIAGIENARPFVTDKEMVKIMDSTVEKLKKRMRG